MYEEDIANILSRYVEESHVQTTNQSKVAQHYFTEKKNFQKITLQDRERVCSMIASDPSFNKYKDAHENLLLIQKLEKEADFQHQFMQFFRRCFVNNVLMEYAKQ